MSEIQIQIGSHQLFGELQIPEKAVGLVLFAHGSGSGRHSSRNQFVARFLESKRLGTLLFDLLTLAEEKVDEMTRELRFDIPFLAKRLLAATDWVEKNYRSLPIGYFGASTGAAAAIVAAAHKKEAVKAIVSRGGRPDLARSDLKSVAAPTLLIVGSLDGEVIELNQTALETLQCVKKLEIVPGASHLFEEPGKLQIVSNLAASWFLQHLPQSSS